jgi:hypothetical protein
LIVLLLGCSAKKDSNQKGIKSVTVIDKVEIMPQIIETNSSASLKVELASPDNDYKYNYKWKLINDEAGKIEADGKQAIYKSGAETGQYKIKVIVSNDNGEQVYAEKTIEVKEEVTSSKRRSLAQNDSNNLGVWLWYLPDTKYDSHNTLAIDLREMGTQRVYVKVNDEGANHYFKPYLDSSVVEAYKNQNLEVWAWGYNYPHSISNQAQALYQATKAGYEGYVLDIEKEFESNSNSLVELVKEVYNAKERAINNGYADRDFKIYLSSFGNIMSHDYIKIDAVDQYIDGYMPQTYLEVWGEKYMQNPEKYVELDKEEYRQAGATKPIHNVISVEYGDIKTSQINRAFQTAGSEASIWRVPRWNGGDPAPDKQWQIIQDVNWGMYGDDSSSHQVNLKAEKIKAGDKSTNYNVEAVINNQSSVDINDFAITLWINGQQYRKKGLEIGAEENKTVNIQADINKASAYNATLLVDSLAQIEETDEHDNKINQTIMFAEDNPPVDDKNLTINHPQQIIKGQEVEFTGEVPEQAEKVIISVDSWALTNDEDKKKLVVEDKKYHLNYSFHQAQKDRDLLVRAFDSDGQLIAQKETNINVRPADEETNDLLTINYPEQIIAGNEIQFKGQVPFAADKVIISVDGYPLTNQAGEKNIKANNGSYKLNYAFDSAEKDRKLVIKAFDEQGNAVEEIKKTITVLSNELLTVAAPAQVEKNNSFKVQGQALSPIHKIVISVDGHILKEQVIEGGEYDYSIKLNQAGRNRKLVINAFDKDGTSVKQLRRTIDVTSEEPTAGENLGAEFANCVNDNWSNLKDEAMANISGGTDCVAFVSAALRDFGYDIHATVTDGITGSQTKEDTLVYNLFTAGFKKSEDISQLKPGDICFTEPEYYPGVELSNPYTPDQREGYFPNHAYIFMSWVNSSNTKYAWVVDNQGRRHKRNMSVSGDYTPFDYFMHLPRDNNDSDDTNDEIDSNLTLQLPEKIKVDETIKISGQATGEIYKIIISVDKWKLDEVMIKDEEYNLNATFNQVGYNRTLAIKAFDKNGRTIKEIKREINVEGAGGEVISDVPYYYQYYNDINGDGSCQNSAVAVVLNYYGWDGNPDTISSSDFGTGTAQTPEGLAKVFNHYAQNGGLDVRVNDHRYGSMSDLNQLLAAGKPVIVHGYFTGYGHVITLVGYDGTYYYANDSAGKWNQHYKGDYHHSAAAGKYVKYHKSNVKDAVYSSDGKLWYHEIYFK